MKIEDLKKIQLKKEDIILVRYKNELSFDMAQALADFFENKVLLVQSFDDIKIISKPNETKK